MTDTRRAYFPCDRNGMRGDTRKRGESGVHVSALRTLSSDYMLGVQVALERSLRMIMGGE